jgi:hypothetical protein
MARNERRPLDDVSELSFRLTKAPSEGGADCRGKGNVCIDGCRPIYKVFKMALESPLGPDERDWRKVKITKLFSAAALLTSFGYTRLSISFPLLHHRRNFAISPRIFRLMEMSIKQPRDGIRSNYLA